MPPQKPKATKTKKRVVTKKPAALAMPQPQKALPSKYVEGVGRRKAAVARVRIFTKGDKEFAVNDRPLALYFPPKNFQEEASSPLQRLNIADKFRIVVRVSGSGVHAQAQAVRHGLARALVKFNPDFRKRLKRAGYLTRDARKVERKKPGLKKARRAPQWQKR